MIANFYCVFSLIETFKQLLEHTMSYVVLKLSVLLLQMNLKQSLVVMLLYKVVIQEFFARQHVEAC